jgi:hypothetical protein
MRKIFAAAATLIALSGCSTMVAFDSNPQGATVTCNACRGWGDMDQKTPIGVTPFQFKVADKPGWYSEYIFTAQKEGYKPSTFKVKEESVVDGTSFEFFPKKIQFELQK